MGPLTHSKEGDIVNPESYAGMEVYTPDGEMVGRVKQPRWEADAPSATEYLVIDRPRARDIAVPRCILRVSDDHLVLPFGMSVVESAPNVNPGRRPLSIEGQWVLDSFYSLWTGVPVAKVEIVKGQSTKQEGEGAVMNEKAKQATDRAKAAADQIIERAKAQSAELIQRSKAKEAELREKAEKQAADLREKAEKQAADLREKASQQAAHLRQKAKQDAAEVREKAKLEAAHLLEKAKAEAADLSAKAKKDAKEHLTKATSKVG
jgi:hypothetical protein